MPDGRELSYWANAIAAHWPLEGELTALPGELDLNFAAPAAQTIFKVMRSGCDRAFLDMQIGLHAHIRARDEGIPVPAVIYTRDGRGIAEIEGPDGEMHLCWAVERLAGRTFDQINPRTPELYRQLGHMTARMTNTLRSFDHPELDRPLKWDLRRANWAQEHVSLLDDPVMQEQVNDILRRHDANVMPGLKQRPVQPIHNDLNDHNLLACASVDGTDLTGIIDFGDAIKAPRICELAIAAAYAVLDNANWINCLIRLIEGFSEVSSISTDDADILYSLIQTRLAVSVVNSAIEKRERPDDPYVVVSEKPALAFLEQSRDHDPAIIRAVIRRAAGHDPCPQMSSALRAMSRAKLQPIFAQDLSRAEIIDLSVTGTELPASSTATPLIGRYAEARLIYTAPVFRAGPHSASPSRTVHTALDVFLPAGTEIVAPLDGVVRHADHETGAQDYGGLVVLEHCVEDTRFCTLYGHLSATSFAGLTPGDAVKAGEVFARLGTEDENGGWVPHLHLQLGLPEQAEGGFAGVFDPDLEDVARAVHPNPAVLLGLDSGAVEAPRLDRRAERARRAHHEPRNLKLSYDDPLPILRGRGVLLYDDRGRAWLDAYNNVPHVGHAHPHVVGAISRQVGLVSTNTRYLQPVWADYAEAISGLMPDGLDVVFCLNSGSEANDLAIRIARQVTGARDIVVSKAGYHGITQAAIEISEYKFAGPGGPGQSPHVHVAEVPDPLRGPLGRYPKDAGPRYAEDVARCIRDAAANGERVAAFISEPFPSVGGQIIPPKDYLRCVYRHIREAGGLCIADEVQTGLGRLGRYMWGFEQQDATPDMVVLGKPVANGHPMGVLVTTREIADAFATQMEFFSTFGGSSVSCAAALAVLEVMETEDIPAHVTHVGDYLLSGLQKLAESHPVFADVRGLGLFLGVDLARPDGTPATEAARYIVNRMREDRVLIGSDGPHDNVLKIRPPLVFTKDDADVLLARLGAILNETPLDPYR